MKLLASDLDGTMMRTQCYVSEYSKKVIGEFIKKGNIFVATTGRCFASAVSKVGDIEGVRYYITSNGCVVYDNKEKEYLFQHYIPKEIAYEIYRDTINLDGSPEVYSGLDSFLERSGYDLALRAFNKELSEDLYLTAIIVDSLEEDIKNGNLPVNKFNLVFHSEEDKKKIFDKYSTRDDIVVTMPTLYNLEVFYVGCDKDTGLRMIAEKEGIAHQDIIAIGDSFNDIKMVQYAALGIAVDNAMQPLKEVADQIILANDADGPAHFIEEEFL